MIQTCEKEGRVVSVKTQKEKDGSYKVIIEQEITAKIQSTRYTEQSKTRTKMRSVIFQRTDLKPYQRRPLERKRIIFTVPEKGTLDSCIQYFHAYGDIEYVTLTKSKPMRKRKGFVLFYSSEVAKGVVTDAPKEWECAYAYARFLNKNEENTIITHNKCQKGVHAANILEHELCCDTLMRLDLNLKQYTPVPDTKQ